MRLSFRIKHHFFSAFRELFVHHHGSLEFRAKIFALLIASSDEEQEDLYYDSVKLIAMNIYTDDPDRVTLLMISVKELVKKVRDDNGLDIDTLVIHIQKELRIVPRYAKKIEVDNLQSILQITTDEDTLAYQKNILEFLQTLKIDTLTNKKEQIVNDEKELNGSKQR